MLFILEPKAIRNWLVQNLCQQDHTNKILICLEAGKCILRRRGRGLRLYIILDFNTWIFSVRSISLWRLVVRSFKIVIYLPWAY